MSYYDPANPPYRREPPSIRDLFGETENLDCLLRHIAPQFPTVPYEMLLNEVQQAYKTFAQKTGLLEWRAVMRFQRYVREYPIDVPKGYSIYKVKLDKEYMFRYVPDVDYWYYWWGQTFRLLGNSVLELKTGPSKDYEHWYVTFCLIPDDCATTIPKEISDAFGQVIAKGAMVNLLRMPNQSWSNPSLAREREREFSAALGSGRMLALTDRGSTPGRFRPVRIL